MARQTEPRASASGYVKVKQVVSKKSEKFSNIRLLTRAALFAYDSSFVHSPLSESQ
jgi:hypothetical protein